MRKQLGKRFIAGAVLGAALLAGGTGIAGSTAQAASYTTTFKKVAENTSAAVKYYNSKSNVLIIGDSRTVQMYNATSGSVSFVSRWGGHYGYGGDYQINNSARETAIKDIVKKQKGMKVYIFATINDYDGTGSEAAPVNNLVTFAKKVKGWASDDTVKVVQLVGKKGGKSVSSFNSTLKKKLPSNISYKKLSTSIGYQSDNVHYTTKTAKNIVNELK